jgi:RNA polymerase sigma factor (sigma-70 family)
MDGYVYVLDALREQDCHRLRTYSPVPRVSFTTWLVVVTRRLVLDFQRRRYGRSRSEDDSRRAEHDSRRRLEDLIVAELDVDRIADSDAGNADLSIRRRELRAALRQALDELPPSDRLLLALRYNDDRPAREIAAMIGSPSVFHVYRRLGSVLAVLKEALLRRGVDEPRP